MPDTAVASISRRAALRPLAAAGLLPFTAASSWAAATRLTIDRVKVYVTPVLPQNRFGTSRFQSEEDPARWRWRGPFAQLAGAIIVEIGTKEGIVGYGMGGGGAAAALIIEKHLSDFLIGSNPLRVELLWDQMYSSSSFYGRRGVTVMALSGVDLALWDLIGRHHGKPVHQLLGGPVKERVPAYYTGFAVEKARELGFRAFKIPIRNGVPEGREGMQRTIAELEKVRQIIGSDSELMIDCSCQWNLPYTLEMIDRLRPLRLAFIEEPLSPDDVLDYAELCRAVHGTRIASGEHEYTRFGYRLLLHHKAVQVLQPDLTWCGGFTEVRRIAAMAAAENLPIIPHRGGSVFGLNLILCTPNAPLAESFGILEPENEILAALTSHFEKGYFYPTDGPGFGHKLSTALLNRHSRAN